MIIKMDTDNDFKKSRRKWYLFRLLLIQKRNIGPFWSMGLSCNIIQIPSCCGAVMTSVQLGYPGISQTNLGYWLWCLSLQGTEGIFFYAFQFSDNTSTWDQDIKVLCNKLSLKRGQFLVIFECLLTFEYHITGDFNISAVQWYSHWSVTQYSYSRYGEARWWDVKLLKSNQSCLHLRCCYN